MIFIGRMFLVFATIIFVISLTTGLILWKPVSKQGVINVLIQNQEVYNGVTEQYDQYTGMLLKTHYFTDQSRGEKLRDLNYDIQTGSILGLPGKILAFIASLIAASLPISGFLIWWGRCKRDKKRSVMM